MCQPWHLGGFYLGEAHQEIDNSVQGHQIRQRLFSAKEQQAARPCIQHCKHNRPHHHVCYWVIAPTRQLEHLQVHQPEAENPIWDHNDDSFSQSSQDSWNPEEVLMAQGCLEGVCYDTELPNIQLTDAMLECTSQIEAKMTDMLNEDLIHLCHHVQLSAKWVMVMAALCGCRWGWPVKASMLLIVKHTFQTFVVGLKNRNTKYWKCDFLLLARSFFVFDFVMYCI